MYNSQYKYIFTKNITELENGDIILNLYVYNGGPSFNILNGNYKNDLYKSIFYYPNNEIFEIDGDHLLEFINKLKLSVNLDKVTDDWDNYIDNFEFSSLYYKDLYFNMRIVSKEESQNTDDKMFISYLKDLDNYQRHIEGTYTKEFGY